jgi:nuclear pore complex protein Nup205
VAVNPDFARQVLFLARELDCSERYIAEILHRITIQNPHLNAVAATEAVVVEFHRRRRDVAESLLLLLQAVDGVSGADSSDTLRQLAGFVYQQLLPGDATNGSQVTLAMRVFAALEGLNSMISNVQIQKQNARSNTADAAGQGKCL